MPHSSARARRTAAVRLLRGAVALLGVTGALVGCANNAAVSEGPVGDSVAAYRAGRYEQAFESGVRVARDGEGADRDRAALITGLSAHALSRRADSERWLQPLLTNQDPEIAGTAGWTLGMAASARGDHLKAASLLTPAAAKLAGDDAAKAGLLAGDSLAHLGRVTAAREEYDSAATKAVSPGLRTQAESKAIALAKAGSGSPVVAAASGDRRSTGGGGGGSGGKGYIIQLGAFADRSTAERHAAANRAAAQRVGKGSPAVIPTTHPQSGATLYGVQIGPFADRPAGEACLRQLGVRGTVMAANR